jgi:hypothetical protein
MHRLDSPRVQPIAHALDTDPRSAVMPANAGIHVFLFFRYVFEKQ